MEEDIETLEDLKNIFIHLKNYGWVNDIKRDVVADKVIKAIENLIARNKKLEDADLTTVYMNGFYDGEKKWKNKIKEKTRYYQELYKQDNSPNEFLISQDCLSKLSFAQELLEESH